MKDTEKIYIIWCRASKNINEPVYKVGRTSQNITDRLAGYTKGSEIMLCMPVHDSKNLEEKILEKLLKTFKQRTDYGKEYFEGDLTEISIIVASMVTESNKINPIQPVKQSVTFDALCTSMPAEIKFLHTEYCKGDSGIYNIFMSYAEDMFMCYKQDGSDLRKSSTQEFITLERMYYIFDYAIHKLLKRLFDWYNAELAKDIDNDIKKKITECIKKYKLPSNKNKIIESLISLIYENTKIFMPIAPEKQFFELYDGNNMTYENYLIWYTANFNVEENKMTENKFNEMYGQYISDLIDILSKKSTPKIGDFIAKYCKYSDKEYIGIPILYEIFVNIYDEAEQSVDDFVKYIKKYYGIKTINGVECLNGYTLAD